MASVTEPGSETQLCSNCKKEIPVANFTIHEIHCSRNIGVCRLCKESIPKSEMKTHIELEHAQVTCKCNMKMEKVHLEEHEASACPLRLVVCQHCEIELAFNKLQDHEDYCGARTERCSACGRNVMVKDLKDHPEVCGKEGEETRVRRERPRYALEDRDADLCTNQIIQNHLGSDGYVETLPRMTRLPESRFYSHFGRDQVLRDENRRNASSVQRAQNPEQEQLERNINSVPSLYGEQDADFDYMLALSLQSETNPCNNTAVGIHRDFWQNFYSKASGLSRCFNESNYSDIFSHDPVEAVNVAHQRKNDIMLPCEFCEVLFPEDDLILHQTGCNPASALASFSKRSSSPSRHSHGGHLRDFLGQLHGTESSGYQSTYLSQQQGVEMDGGSIIIPCEFCGIQLEEEVLFHHQDQCDLRPATANSERSSSQQTLLSSRPQEGMESPDLPRRHIRHQGEISPGYLEEFRQQALVHPVQGSRPVSNFAVARNIRPIFPGGTARDNDALNTPRVKVGNLSAGEGRTRDPEAVSLPTGRPPHNRHPESYVPSFPRMSPIRPSARNEEGRSPRVANGPANFRNRSVKAKPQKPKSGYPDKEE